MFRSTIRHQMDLDYALLTVAASPDGTRFAALGMGNHHLWSTPDGELLHSQSSGWSASTARENRSQSLALTDGRQVRVLDRFGATRWSSNPMSSTVTHVPEQHT